MERVNDTFLLVGRLLMASLFLSAGLPKALGGYEGFAKYIGGLGGRVEDGRGSLGPMASAPFPIPAHRTGRADLRHPALRLASS
jgi:uncharacterized membrane protein YphA (DoxX/SURF4 family)